MTQRHSFWYHLKKNPAVLPLPFRSLGMFKMSTIEHLLLLQRKNNSQI